MSTPSHPFELAAFATAAIPGLQVVEIRSPQRITPSGAFTTIVDSRGDSWLVEAPALEYSEGQLDSLQEILAFLSASSANGDLNFTVPRPAGIARADRGFVVVSKSPGGSPGEEETALTDTLFASSLGRSLAELHNLPVLKLAQAGAPAWTTRQVRERVRELVADCGTAIPTALRQRWLAAADHDQLWTFSPAVIHGELDAGSIWSLDGAVLAITGFWDANVADPAEDLAWILPLASDHFVQSFHGAYARGRVEPDLHVMSRAQLYSELALAKWLQHGLRSGDPEIVAEAEGMLRDLDEALGGEYLAEPTEAVAPIHFEPEDEPLAKLRQNTEGLSGEISEEISTLDIVDQLSSYQYPPEDPAELATEDLSAVVDDIVAEHLLPDEE